MVERPTIFVSMAAYRDSETPKTIEDLFAKADHPERVFVGLLNQLDLQLDMAFSPKEHANVRQCLVPHHESRGACWARSRVFTDLLGQEEYVLQIDSHMRFDKGWDTRLLAQWSLANDPMAVLTHYPMPYDSATGVCNEQMFTQFNCQHFDSWGLPKITSAALSLCDAPLLPKYTVFLAGGCFFTKAHAVRRVPYDPHLYFNGEEINYAVRLWTHGYNLYLPTHPFVYHDYGVDRGRQHHWSDNPAWVAANDLALARLRYLLGICDTALPEALVEIDKYCLGTQRTLVQWQIQHGVHFKRQLLCENVKRGEFV